MTIEPDSVTADQGHRHPPAQDGHAAQGRHHRLRPRPELRGLGAHQGDGRGRHADQAALRRDPQRRRHRLHAPTCAPLSRPDTYTLKGGGQETYEALHLPRLPLRRGHGRHARQPRGPRGQQRPPRVRHLPSSNALVNQIQSAIRWGQGSNFLAVPTDASQRDERLGWTGDIQAFATTGTFNGDAYGYLRQWLQTLRDSQSANGAFPDVAPVTCCGDGVAGWGDAGTVVPFALYKRYGDAAHPARELRRDEALDRLPAGQLQQPHPPQQRLRRLGSRPTPRPRTSSGRRSSPSRPTSSARPRRPWARTPTPPPTQTLYAQIKSAFANRWSRAPTARWGPAARRATCSRSSSGSSRMT